MKEYVFSFKQDRSPNAKPHLSRQEGKNEDDAFNKILKLYPGAVKIAGFEVDDALDKILSAIKHVEPKELKDLDDAHALAMANVNALAQAKTQAADLKRLKTADAILQKTLENGEMAQTDWNTICSSLSPEEKKNLYDEFKEDADKNHNDPKQAELEKMFIDYIFGVKKKGAWNRDIMTARDLAKILGISHVRVLAILKAALAKMVNNIAKLKHYPFKITTAEEAMSLLMADNIVNPEQLKLKAKMHGGISFETAMKNYVKFEKAAKDARAAKKKADDKRYRAAMKEYNQLQKELNQLRAEMNLPKQYDNYFRFFSGLKLGNWS